MYTSWSKVPGRRSPGLGSTRQRPPLSGEKESAVSSAESLSRKIGSDSRERSRTIARVAIRRRATKVMQREYDTDQVHRNRGTRSVWAGSGSDRCSLGDARHPGYERNRRRRQGRTAERRGPAVRPEHRAVHGNAHRSRQRRPDTAERQRYLSSVVEGHRLCPAYRDRTDVLLAAGSGCRYDGEVSDRPGAAQRASGVAPRWVRVPAAQAGMARQPTARRRRGQVAEASSLVHAAEGGPAIARSRRRNRWKNRLYRRLRPSRLLAWRRPS